MSDNETKRISTVSPDSPLSHRGGNPDSHQNAVDFIGLHKRTERVVAALFMVTEQMSDLNPLKAKIRTLGVELMSFILGSRVSAMNDTALFSEKYSSRLLEVLSMLEISYLAEQFSEMNFRLVSEEINRLLDTTDKLKKRTESASLGLSPKAPHTQSSVFGRQRESILSSNVRLGSLLHSSIRGRSKGHSLGHGRATLSYIKSDRSIAVPIISRQSRRGPILDLLKNGAKLSVKDFLSVMSGLSEKTIQRELMAMVKDGVLKREGERRWSKYSVVEAKGNVAPSLEVSQ